MARKITSTLGTAALRATLRLISQVATCLLIAVAAGMLDRAAAQEHPTSMGELADVLTAGSAGPWTAAVDGPGFVLDNQTEPSQVRYFQKGPTLIGVRVGRREASVTIESDFRTDVPISAAGLLFSFDREHRFYHALTIGARGRVIVWRRDAAGLRPVMNVIRDELIDSGRYELRVVARANGTEAFINGTSIGTVEHPAAAAGNVGIIAIGCGRSRYSDYVSLLVTGGE